MARLGDILLARRAEILHKWTSSIRALSGASAVTTIELVDHLPNVLDELTEILRKAPDEGVAPGRMPTAGKHGTQRFRLGFVIESVVREYALLHRSIIEVVEDKGVMVSVHEQRILTDFIFSAVSEAVAQYSHQRDVELHRQSSEHLASLANELRSPLASVRFALGSLHGKELVESTPLAETLARGINEMNDVIEGALRQDEGSVRRGR